jgi:transposase
MQNDTRIAVDVAKAVFEVAVSDRPGRVVRRERLPRAQFLTFFANHPAATVVMEACGSAHYWGRRLEDLGHRVLLLPPHHVRPYVRRNKTDRTDAKGILEASRNEDIHPVPVKTVPQQVLTSLHRLRSGWMTERTARLNALRGLLREQGVFIPVGARQVVPAVWALLEDADSDFPHALRPLFAQACQEIRDIEARIKHVERQLEALTEQLPVVALLLSIPGIGLLTATALLAFLGDIHRFPSGRHLASYLGLTPREFSSGLKRHLGRIWDPHPWRPLRPPPRTYPPARPPARVGAQAGTHPPPQQGRRGRGQQARPHRLGRLDTTAALRRSDQGRLTGGHGQPRPRTTAL